MARVCLLVLVGLLLAPMPSGAEAPPEGAPLSLQDALALARSANASLAAARLRRAVDEAGIDLARERPNPEARYERAKETPRDALGLSQLLELGGKRGRRIAVAEAVAHTGEAELAQAEADVLADVGRAFFALAGAQRRLETARELKDLAGRARAAAADRYQAGDVSRLDVLQAELVLSQADNEAAALDGELLAARADLNALVGREISAPTAAADDVEAATLPDPVQASALALQANAALLVLDRQVAEAEARAALARAQRVPDPILEGTVTHGAEPEFNWGYRAAVAVSVPLFTRHTAQVRVEAATAALVRAQRDALAQRIRGAAGAAAARASAQWEQYRRYRDVILPRSREVESMAEESYRAGQTNLVALLQALQAARELRGRALQSAADYEAALAELQRAMTTGPR